MKSAIQISVVVPIYNVEKFLEKCLNSVLAQTFESFEVLLVIDGATDNSLDIASRFEAKDSRFKVIEQDNKGLGGARNTGINQAVGKYLFLLDSDDYIEKNALSKSFDYAEKLDLDLLIFNYKKIDEQGVVMSAPKFGDGEVDKETAMKNILSLRTSPQAWNKLYKTAMFSDYDIAYPEKFLHEDLPVTYKLFWCAEKIGYLDESLYYWLHREGSITRNFTFKHINDVVISFKEQKDFLKSNGIFEKHEGCHLLGAATMLDVLINRSIEFSYLTTAFSVYIKYLLDSEEIISCEPSSLELLRKEDAVFFEKFSSNVQRLEEFVTKVNLKQEQISGIELYSGKPLADSRSQRVIDMLVPIGSLRRSLVKKMLRKH